MADLAVLDTPEYRSRPVRDYWDDYDTLFYNGWIKNIKVVPTKFADLALLEQLGIYYQAKEIWQRMGLGSMGWQFYGLYPELVYQFFASARIEYFDPTICDANSGCLSFMLQGQRYRITFNEICELYGWQIGGHLTRIPEKFVDADILWSKIASTEFDSRGGSTHAHIRHPVIRYIVKMISHTILGKFEPGKMRVSELVLLHYGIGHLLDDYYLVPESAPPALEDINYGAVFAYQLLSHQTKGLQPSSTSTKKTLTVGSLLSPIFDHALRRALRDNQPDLTYAKFNLPHLKHGKFFTGNGDYQFTTADQELSIPLPSEYTRIESVEDLLFAPPLELCTVLSRPTRRGSSSARPSTTEDPMVGLFGDPSDPGFVGMVPADFSAYEPPPRPDPSDQRAVNEWMMENSSRQTSVMRRIWAALSCIRRPAVRESTAPSTSTQAAGPSRPRQRQTRPREPSRSTTDTDEE